MRVRKESELRKAVPAVPTLCGILITSSGMKGRFTLPTYPRARRCPVSQTMASDSPRLPHIRKEASTVRTHRPWWTTIRSFHFDVIWILLIVDARHQPANLLVPLPIPLPSFILPSTTRTIMIMAGKSATNTTTPSLPPEIRDIITTTISYIPNSTRLREPTYLGLDRV